MITAGEIVGWVIGALGVLATVAELFTVRSKKRKIVDDVRQAGDATPELANTAVSPLQQVVQLKLDQVLDRKLNRVLDQLLQPRQDQILQDEIASLHRELAVVRDKNTALQSEIAKLRPESRTEAPRQDHQLR